MAEIAKQMFAVSLEDHYLHMSSSTTKSDGHEGDDAILMSKGVDSNVWLLCPLCFVPMLTTLSVSEINPHQHCMVWT